MQWEPSMHVLLLLRFLLCCQAYHLPLLIEQKLRYVWKVLLGQWAWDGRGLCTWDSSLQLCSDRFLSQPPHYH